jgi:hypothetical protein
VVKTQVALITHFGNQTSHSRIRLAFLCMSGHSQLNCIIPHIKDAFPLLARSGLDMACDLKIPESKSLLGAFCSNETYGSHSYSKWRSDRVECPTWTIEMYCTICDPAPGSSGMDSMRDLAVETR